MKIRCNSMFSFCLASGRQSRVDSSRSPCFFDHEDDPFVGKSISVGYRIGGGVPGTAILRIYTLDGFIMAADGMRRSFHKGQVVTDKQQKIFVVEQSAGLVAYALTGITYFEDGQTTFSVSDAVGKIANELLMERFTHADRYAIKFGNMVRDALRQGQRDGKIQGFEDIGKPNLVVTIVLAGYLKGNAFMADIDLSHRKQRLQPPELREFVIYSDKPGAKISGSDLVLHELLYGDDRDFVRFRSAGFAKLNESRPELSEAEAIELASNYLAACMDPKGRALDPECEAIGGHIHIAAVKPDGFRWIIPPA